MIVKKMNRGAKVLISRRITNTNSAVINKIGLVKLLLLARRLDSICPSYTPQCHVRYKKNHLPIWAAANTLVKASLSTEEMMTKFC
jgi:hypothetical protein